MRSNRIVLFTINDYDNLGVGYLGSALSEAGYDTMIIDPRRSKKHVLRKVKSADPLLIGFSIIYLNHISLFTDLIDFLRNAGVDCHFTAGGHYASLRYRELFKLTRGLDSVVRFEGEITLTELARSVQMDMNWKKVDGIAFPESNKIVTNRLRNVELNLDRFPYPLRASIRKYAFNKKFTPILAGRGCVNNCSFCNTREFYIQAGGPVKRIRKPELVVSEMEYLFRRRNCSIFIFHDDDFPLKTTLEKRWIERFCHEIEVRGLKGKIMWKINCRPDEVDEASFGLMKNHGLFLVFLGIEDGTEDGLRRLQKKLSPRKSLECIKILRNLSIGYDYGFMLFQPATTFRSLYKNIAFLRNITYEGYSASTFLRLLPLYETKVEKELRKQGRLINKDTGPIYDFTEIPMNQYYEFLMNCFSMWMQRPDGLENLSKWARNYISVFTHYFIVTNEAKRLFRKIKQYTSESNSMMIDSMQNIAFVFESGKYLSDPDYLESLKETVMKHHEQYRRKIENTMSDIMALATQ